MYRSLLFFIEEKTKNTINKRDNTQETYQIIKPIRQAANPFSRGPVQLIKNKQEPAV